MSVPAVFVLGVLAATAAMATDVAELEARGRQIYHKGTSPAATPIPAFLGVDQMKLPASAVPCGSCHGMNGRGRPEGGVVPSDITWSELTKSYGHEHEFGRRHAAFDEASLAVSIIRGVDPAGNKLDVAMPRYGMEKRDIDALIAYMKRLEFDFDPGVSEHAVRLGTLLPLSGPAASQGEAIRAVLNAFVRELNNGGGINGRNLELDVIPMGATPAQTLENVQSAPGSAGFFALVAVYASEADAELAALLRQMNVPIVGPVTRTPDTARDRLPQTYYLYAGTEELMLSLNRFAASEDSDKARRQCVVGPDSDLLRNLDRHFSAVDDSATAALPYAESEFSPTATAAELSDSDDVYFVGTAMQLERLIDALAASKTVPRIFLPPETATPNLVKAPVEFDGRIFVAYPTMPGDVSDNGRQAYAALSAVGDLPSAHFASQVTALAAARILVEAIQRAGHALTRERLIAELESMNGYETGLTPPVSFNLNRRVGALGAHIATLDLKTGRLAPAAAWMPLR